MASPPTPADDVPDFVVERFEEHDPETLLDIVAYEADRARSTAVPKYVTEVFVMQDDETKRAIAAYARDLAAHKEQVEAQPTAGESETAADGGRQSDSTDEASGSSQSSGSDDDDDDGGPSGFTTGPMFG